MLTCKETVIILSSDQELSFRQKLELRVHLLLCKHCSSYSKQLKVLVLQLKQNFKEITKTESKHIQELENKILNDIKKS